MKKSIVGTVTAITLLAISGPTFGQASEQDKRQCESIARGYASSIMSAKRNHAKDLESMFGRGTSWTDQVARYMAQSAAHSDSMTESELAALGAHYCLQRKPSSTR